MMPMRPLRACATASAMSSVQRRLDRNERSPAATTPPGSKTVPTFRSDLGFEERMIDHSSLKPLRINTVVVTDHSL